MVWRQLDSNRIIGSPMLGYNVMMFANMQIMCMACACRADYIPIYSIGRSRQSYCIRVVWLCIFLIRILMMTAVQSSYASLYAVSPVMCSMPAKIDLLLIPTIVGFPNCKVSKGFMKQ